LIRHGHREPDIPEYSLEKFQRYVAAARRSEAQDRLVYVFDTVAAIAGALSKEAGLDKHLKALQQQAEQ